MLMDFYLLVFIKTLKKTVASTLLTCFDAIDFVLLSVYTFEDMIFRHVIIKFIVQLVH